MERVVVVAERRYESCLAAFAQALRLRFDIKPFYTPLDEGRMQEVVELARFQGWLIVCVPMEEYPAIVPRLMRAVDPDKLLIVIADNIQARESLIGMVQQRPCIALLPDAAPCRVSPEEHRFRATMRCILSTVAAKEHKAFQARFADQTPGIEITIV